MSIMVTGGCGFIGSHFIKKICKHYHGEQIINVDAKTYAARLPMWTEFPVNLINEWEDIRDQATIEKLIEKYNPSIIFHFAAESHVCRSIKGPKEFITTNINGTFNLLEAFRHKNDVKFVHISTDEVFGEWDPARNPFSLCSPIRPRSPYAASKAAAEMLIQAWGTTYGLVYTLVNMTNVFGPNQHPEKLMPMTISKILKGEEVTVHGSGEHMREWLYVDNAIDGIIKASESTIEAKRFLLGGDQLWRNIELIKEIHGIIEQHLPEMKLPLKLKHNDDRPTDDFGYSVDSRFAVESLNWDNGRGSFKDNLRETVRWYVHDILERGGRTAHGWAG